MTKVARSTRITGSKDRVWAALADLGAVQNFNPGVARSYYTSDLKEGVGAARVCELIPMGKIEERAIDWQDGEAMTLEIIPIEKAPPFRSAQGRFRLTEVDDATVEVSLTLEYRLKFGILGALMDRLMVRRQFEKVVPLLLKGLKRHVETGEIFNGAERKWRPAAV